MRSLARIGVGLLAALTLSACGGPPQRKDEATVVYRAGFTAESGVTTQVVFPFPSDGTAAQVEAGLVVTDGGSARVQVLDGGGGGLAVEGRGHIEASYSSLRVKGLAESEGIPAAGLTRQVPDGGAGDLLVHVNKGGSSVATVDFEYTVGRDCGGGCGGTRSWKFQGPVGLGEQEVPMTFSEEKKR